MEKKGKLYITYNASLRSLLPEHIEVFHGVRESNIKNIINRRKNIYKSHSFRPVNKITTHNKF